MASSTRTHHAILDLPSVSPYRTHTLDAIAIVFLFKALISQREEVLQTIKSGHVASTDEQVRAIGVVPWLRSFPPTESDIANMATSQVIFIDSRMLQDDMCIVCQGLQRSAAPNNKPTFEFAEVHLLEAYDIVTTAQWGRSWFPTTIPASHKLDFAIESDTIIEREGPRLNCEIPVFIVVDVSPEQKQLLYEILSSDFAEEPDFLHVPNTSPHIDDIDHLMQYFLENAWFPGDFAVVDAQTIAELSVPNCSSAIGSSEQPYPSFMLATSSHIRHPASDSQDIGKDDVGYAVARKHVEDEGDFGWWCGNVFKGMGLRSFIGWDNDGQFEGDLYYWNCWLNDNGMVDGEVRNKLDIKY
jgi:hypothetical protein